MNDDKPVYPFGIIPAEVFMDERLTLETLRVLGALYTFRDKHTSLAFPSRDELSSRCTAIHPSNISAATTKLVELGWLVKEGRGGNSRATRYTIRVPEAVTEMAARHKAISSARRDKRVAEQATVAQSATVAEQATPPVAQKAIRACSPEGYTQGIAQQTTRIEQTNRTDQIGTDQGTHIEESVCATATIKPGTAGFISAAIQKQGVIQCNPSHPTLDALIKAGATEQEFSEAAKIAVANGKGNFNYVLGIVRRQREDAAKLVLHKGRLPNKQESIQAQNLSVAATWLPPELKEKNHAG